MTTKDIIKKKLWAILSSVFFGSQFPDQGLNPCLPHWKRGVLTTGRPGKSRYLPVWLKTKRGTQHVTVFISSFKFFLNCKAFFHSYSHEKSCVFISKVGFGVSFVSDKIVIWFPALCFQWAGAGFLFESTERGAEETPVWEHCWPPERRAALHPEESGQELQRCPPRVWGPHPGSSGQIQRWEAEERDSHLYAGWFSLVCKREG